MGLHKNITVDNNHVSHSWVVADATTRLALSVGPEDVGKIAKQETPLSFWVLTDDDPLTWVEITGGGGSVSHDSLTDVTANQHHNQAHDLGGADHNTATLAELNTKVSDATLDGSSGTRPPTAHGAAAHTGTIGAHSAISDVGVDDHHDQLHGSTHGPGQSDVVKLDDLDTPDDNTDLNTSTGAHGLAPKLDDDDSHYLDGKGAWTTPAGGGGIFGADYESEVSLAESSTTSSSFQTKLQHVTPALTGTYRVAWSALMYHSTVADSVQARLMNVTDTVDVTGTASKESNHNDDRIQVGAFAEVVFSGVAKTFEIQWRQDRGGTAYIAHARFEIWRVA